MAAMVQTYTQQPGTVTLLQARPTSASGIMSGHSHSQSQSNSQYMHNTQPHRNSFHGLPGVNMGQNGYRGSSTVPVQPYAFMATPSLTNGGQGQSFGTFRTNSTPSVPTTQMMDSNATRTRYYANASMTNLPSSAGSSVAMNQRMSRDDLSLPSTGGSMSTGASRPHPTFAQVAASKASPDRYRRPSPRHTDSFSGSPQSPGSAMPSGTGMATVVHFYNPRTAVGERRMSNPRVNRPHSAYGSMPGAAADDMLVQRRPNDDETKKRFRRRSMHSFDSADYPQPLTPQEFKQQQRLAEESLRTERKNNISDKDQKSVGRLAPVAVAHTRNGSSESLVSSRSSNSRPSSSTNRNSNASAPTTSPASTTAQSDERSNSEQSKLNIPPRSSSSDVSKRVLSPSPLSKPVNMASESSADDGATPAALPSPTRPPGSSHGSVVESPAAKQLAALNEKGGRPKSKTSRLRRAFSFGSATEFKKAANSDVGFNGNKAADNNEASKLHKEPRGGDLYEEEQARIAQKQEESGLGNSIYAGTKIFAGSTDNLSISSTASSASIMLRKMGKGMKKGGRSLVGLFRPKSMIGASSKDKSAPEASQATVSMITVEAERERVNVNSNTDLNQKPGTGFPRLERNSMDAMDDTHTNSMKSDPGADNSGTRKSIVGGERERAEVLATIRKGILKTRSNSPSPAPRGQDGKGTATTFELPMIPNVSDSPSSSAPSTPNEDASGHKRNGSVAIGNEDYFMSALRLRQDSTKSAPGTPQGSVGKRNATFSPRIVFYDTWPSQEYDRRGDIATCNRLTPMLAQQIKEELNSFKMEMEVHETSKIYTHFF